MFSGGWNGGGGTYDTDWSGCDPGQGGGASDIRIGGTALSDRIIVAGGGGGGAYNYDGGNGGGTSGSSGDGSSYSRRGQGGTQSA